ncbi:hypothetical protein SDRG_06067 [Saprolegnia diclina VS20]|uniref:Methyltransferase domain-containing protein n=1 Tax=Saprolegnia diclina (strain VS20) TaxID=1156394 RepID=T0S1Q5_SAPDV|nr:hypothetical protein SDRG_06067 [Saprolegnia diclina VS20]EQC36627.1 hypothetical protein SDRG_06067 [Saprolegnia diclina VS20]|eukprot:XP_008610048.1 hypothetical protein SDRG_06067 [Saprolegnia diclina VS20]
MIAPRKTLHSTPRAVLAEAFALAKVGPSDVICDVGCGDGRVLLYAVTELCVAKSIGIEIDRARVEAIRASAASMGISDKVHIHCGNALEIPIDDDVTVLFLFLIERGLKQVFRQLEACTSRLRAKPLRILTYLYRIDAMDPYLVETRMCAATADGATKADAKFPIYLYMLPPKADLTPPLP